ncbi:MAG: amidase [Nocardioidaceae bacterium]
MSSPRQRSDAILRPVRVVGSQSGPLSGLTFAVKDVIDVAGAPTTAGNDFWARSHPAVTRHATVVQQLLDGGATLVGKAVSDELAFSINGSNPHHGTPINPAAPGHLPGGSSSGSASAVASGTCDFALGTDSGGSVRVPASYCGVFGLRPTWGTVDLHGIVPLTSSFDTVGWLARSIEVMDAVARYLLPRTDRDRPVRSVVPVAEAFALVATQVSGRLLSALDARFGNMAAPPRALGIDLREWASVRGVIQSYETWATHGTWASRHLDTLGAGVRGRLERCAETSKVEYEEARRWRRDACRRLESAVATDEVLCLPSAAGTPPALGAPAEDVAEQRERTFALTSVAGIWRSPQLSVPAGTVQRLPVGLGLLGRPGDDLRLLDSWRAPCL